MPEQAQVISEAAPADVALSVASETAVSAPLADLVAAQTTVQEAKATPAFAPAVSDPVAAQPALPAGADTLLPAANPQATAPAAPDTAQPASASPQAAAPSQSLPASATEPAATPLDSPKPQDRQQVAQNALERQLNNGPAPKDHLWEVRARIGNENRAGRITAPDEGTAWARFCDGQNLKESQRARRFARPVITDLGEVTA